MTSPPGLWRRWFGHRVTGIGTLLFAIATGLFGGVLSLLLRLPDFPDFRPVWQVLARAHAPILTLFCAIPALTIGFGTLLVPPRIGAGGTAFPKLASSAFGLTMLGFALSLTGLLSAHPTWFIACATVTALGAVLGAANLVTTILNDRHLPWGRIGVLVWSELIAACLTIVAAPIMAASFSLSVRHGLALETALGAILAPALFIMLLPAFGLVGEIVTGLAQRPIPGRRTLVLAMAIPATAAFMLWAGALFHGETASLWNSRALVATIGVQTVVMAGCWLVAVSRSGRWSALASTPGLNATGFIAVMVAGVLSGDRLHEASSLAIVFALFAGFYGWTARLTGLRVPETLGRVQSWLLIGGVVALLMPVAAFRVIGAAMISLSVGLFACLLGVMLIWRRHAATVRRGAAPIEGAPVDWAPAGPTP